MAAAEMDQVADEAAKVLQSKTVMNGDEIDACPGTPTAPVEDVGRSSHARRQIGDETLISPPKSSDSVAVVCVPLGPAWREVAELVAVRTEIPRFRNQLYPGQNRVLTDCVEESTTLSVIAVLACQRRA